MSSQTIDKVKNLRDNQIAPVIRDVFNSVFSEIPYDDVVKLAAQTAELDSLTRLGDSALDTRLDGSEVVDVGRLLLSELAGSSATESIVSDACDRSNDSDTMFIGTALAAGALINLTYLVMATDIEIRRDEKGKRTWVIKKAAASPKLISSVLEKLAKLLPLGS